MNTFLSIVALASAASAQIVVNGFSEVTISTANAQPPQASSAIISSSAGGVLDASSSPSAVVSSSSDNVAYQPPAYTVAAASSSAPPSYYTPPPAAQQMSYSSFMAGGYKTMDCGYGYQKMQDGSCQQQSWVRWFHSLPISYLAHDVSCNGSGKHKDVTKISKWIDFIS